MDPSASIAEQATEYQAQGIWLDVWPGQTRPVALELAEQAAKRVEGEIHARILSHAPKLWSLMQAKARRSLTRWPRSRKCRASYGP